MLDQLRRWFGVRPVQQRPRQSKPGKHRARPNLELLEDRLTPSVYNVISTADNTNAVITAGHAGTASDPFLAPSLRSAISAANANPGGNTINLTVAGTYKIALAGTPGETDNAAGEFAIGTGGGDLTIQNTSGGTAIVDGNHLNRVFDINPGNTDNPATKILATFTGFTIQNGLAQPGDLAGGSGGGIRDQGNASLTLSNMVVTDNSASADGGGVSMENAPASTPWTLTIDSSTISLNHAGDAGGGIETDGAGHVFLNTGTTITDNTCVNQGAAVWLDATPDGVDSVTITNPGTGYTTAPTATFSAPQNAGGTTATGTATITGGVVTGVTIINPGTGYTTAPTVAFSAPPAGITATGTPNLGFDNSATLTMTGVLVNGNAALNGPTGAIGNSGNATVTITNCTVENNSSGSTGGGFGDSMNLGTLIVANSYFVGNTAVGNGGGIQEGGPSTTITDSVIQGNSTNAAGGGVFANGTTLTMLDSTLSNNTSTFTAATPPNLGGGGLEVQTTGTGAAASTITNTTIAGNSVLNSAGNNNGGGVDASANFTGTLTLLNDTIAGNYADSGGGIFWTGTAGSTLNVQNTIIATNTANVAGPDADNAAGTFTDNGGNLIGISGAGSGNTGFSAGTTQAGTVATPLDPLLGPLGNNGGPTVGAAGTQTLETEALLPGSPAIMKGVNTGAPGLDERGFLRADFVLATTVDVGAFQFQAASPQTFSTNPGNGDANPYGVGFVPTNFPTSGVLQPGDLLVSNFNNSTGAQGTGTTVVRITPGGQSSLFFTSTLPGLSAVLGFLQAGFVIVGNVPSLGGVPQAGAGAIQILDSNGAVVLTITDPTLLGNPWDFAVNDQGSTAQLFVSNVLPSPNGGIVTRIDLSIAGGTVSVVRKVQVGSGFATRPDAAAFVAGPAGLAYDATHDILYVASTADNSIYKIAGAGTTMTALTGTGTLVTSDPVHLHGPLGLMFAPNGNLIVANADLPAFADPNQPSELAEFTTAGVFVGQFSLDPSNGGAFQTAVQTVGAQTRFAALDDNTGTVSVWSLSSQPITLSVSVAPSGPPAGLGSTATFTITVTNTGPIDLPADNTTVSVTLPAGLTAAASSPLTFTVGALPAGQSATFTIQASATATGPDTVTATLTSPDTSPNSVSGNTTITVLTAAERFVRALYLDDLGRPGSIAELDNWVAMLNGAGGSRLAVASDIAESFEARDDLVKSWYETYLGRQAMNGEEQGWANLLLTQTEEQVLSQILASAEFFSHAQTLVASGTADQRFVGALYQLLLARTAGANEVSGWVGDLPQLGQQGVAFAILRSQEYRMDLITGDYTTLLHRSPDLVGLDGWVFSGLDAASVRVGFESSSEFFTNG